MQEAPQVKHGPPPETVEARENQASENRELPDFKMLVNRFELNSQGWLVGFELKSDALGKRSFVDAIVPFDCVKDKNDHEICCEAWKLLKNKIRREKQSFAGTPRVLGAEFLPPEDL